MSALELMAGGEFGGVGGCGQDWLMCDFGRKFIGFLTWYVSFGACEQGRLRSEFGGWLW